MNVLILSVGARNKIVQYFRKTLGGTGKVIATDMSPLAPALYEADKHYIVPRITEPDYMDIILDICQKEQVTGVLSLIDPELSLLAAHQADFRAVGTQVIGSSYELCEMSLDKWQMYQWLTKHGYRCAKTYDALESFEKALKSGALSFPVFVKPACGSASVSISKAYNWKMLELLMRQEKGLIVQEYLQGQEIGADVYIDILSHEVVSIFTKKKLVMRAGETDKAVSFKDENLFRLIEKFVTEAGYCGQIDIDIFEVDGTYFISEVNPRFGGGYPHAYACGCDHMQLILNDLKGVANKKTIGAYREGIYMMKYNEVLMKEIDR